MNLALQQAKKNLGNTKENPSVGCVIVKNNNLISAGYTSLGGRPHAEQNAISASKNEIINSYLYVTLEPCSHFGKTPPCVNKIIKKKIKKVIFSIADPDKRSLNKASINLRKNRIDVTSGILREEITEFYNSYIRSKKQIMPFVTCKIALSKDFFTINKKKKWITNKYSRGRVHLIRSNHDCIVTSSSTVNADNPELTCRIDGLYRTSPSRIIIDKNLKINMNAKIIKKATNFRTIIFYNKDKSKKVNLLKRFKVKLIKVPLDENGNIDLKKSLIIAKQLGFSRILLESGLKLTKSFLSKKLVNDLIVFISDKKIGKNGKNNFKNLLKHFAKSKKRKDVKINLFGDKFLSYKFK